jgi:KaiC/GvpD/RAD55 family RecA-like ATPase
MIISDTLSRMMNNPDIEISQDHLLFVKEDLIRTYVQQYFGNGFTQSDIYQNLRMDVNKCGPEIPASKIKRIISQEWSRCIIDNNVQKHLESIYIGDPQAHLAKYATEVRTWGKTPILRTGIERLDKAYGGGLLPGQLMVITGGEGSMKTSLALKMIDTYLQEVGEKILYFSLDMEAERIAFRRILPLLGMGYKEALMAMQTNSQEYQEALARRTEVDRDNLRIVDGPHSLKKIQLVISLENPSVVFIDYLTCIEGFRSELDCARESIKQIRKLKREYDFTFVTLNQISEQSKSNQRQGVTNPPAMGGGSSQQAADVKIDLLKDTPSPTEDSPLSGKPRIIATVSKTRDEVAGRSFDLDYEGMTMSFTGEAKEVFRIKEPKTIFSDVEFPF